MEHRAREQLLQIARDAVAANLDGGKYTPDGGGHTDLEQCVGCFVTVKIDRGLRGCIGLLQSDQPLYESVAEMAVAAAMRDPRFPPMSRNELERSNIDISVLSEFVRVENPEEIQPGRDGLYVRRGIYSGLLLPQVATEYGWDRETFLDQTCVKAGLGPGAWRSPGMEIYRFTAEVFGEDE